MVYLGHLAVLQDQGRGAPWCLQRVRLQQQPLLGAAQVLRGKDHAVLGAAPDGQQTAACIGGRKRIMDTL